MSYYQNNSRGNKQRNSINSNDGQISAKRKKRYRWSNRSKVREDEMGLKKERQSDNYGGDASSFGSAFVSPRNYAQGFNYEGDMYNYNDQYNHDKYNNYNHQGLPNSGHNMREIHRSSATQAQKFRSETRSENFVETQHTGTSWVWEKYHNEIHNWQDKHKLSYYKARCMALEFENQMLFEQVKSLIEENSVFAAERGEVPAMLLPNFPGGQKGFESENTTAKKPRTVVEDSKNNNKDRKSSDESLVCDVPETMVAVIEKSMRHKLDLHKARKELATKEKAKETQVKEEEGTKIEGPKEPRGFKRKEELEQLYGENAELIQSLETAIQHNFNRNCDNYNPQMWMPEPMNPVLAN